MLRQAEGAHPSFCVGSVWNSLSILQIGLGVIHFASLLVGSPVSERTIEVNRATGRVA